MRQLEQRILCLSIAAAIVLRPPRRLKLSRLFNEENGDELRPGRKPFYCENFVKKRCFHASLALCDRKRGSPRTAVICKLEIPWRNCCRIPSSFFLTSLSMTPRMHWAVGATAASESWCAIV